MVHFQQAKINWGTLLRFREMTKSEGRNETLKYLHAVQVALFMHRNTPMTQRPKMQRKEIKAHLHMNTHTVMKIHKSDRNTIPYCSSESSKATIYEYRSYYKTLMA